ncbi:MAG TPA: tetratricopeptide repeat protein [Planctomycetota bacterium]|nr:tetratricopeptide repeat protein [Planctomycetota bacterium]
MSFIFTFFIFHFALSCRADLGPQNVAVVVNPESWASLAIANEYVHLRGIPGCNVIYLDHLPNFETVDINFFHEQILKPVLKTIEERGLTPQIDCIAYSADIPYAIDTSPDKSPEKLPNIFTRTASITGLTFLYERVLAKDTAYLRLNANRYMRWVKVPQDQTLSAAERTRYVEAVALIEGKEKKFDQALPIFDELSKAHPKNHELQYNLACCLAQLKKFDEAMSALRAAVDAGWYDVYHTREDNDLAGLRERADFKDLLKTLEAQTLETQPTHGFRASYAWNEKGEIAADGKGEHYMLSTLLAETSGRGTSVNETLKYLRESAKADGTHPDGDVFFMLNGDIRSKTRRWGFASAVHQLAALGVHADILEGVLPKNMGSVMGLMAGSADFDWNSSGSVIAPGAICEHLTSCGGELAQHRGQTPCTQFLRFGAAGTSGAVQEPYAIQAKFPSPFIHVHYARGCTLAEAFYQSVSGPYQLIIVGDPLCAPWRKQIDVTLQGIDLQNPFTKSKGVLALKPSAAQPTPAIARFELFVDGIRHSSVAPGESFQLNTKEFSDGHHQLTVAAIESGPIETQHALRANVLFGNRDGSLYLAKQKKGSYDASEQIDLTADAKGAALIEIRGEGERSLAKINGANGRFNVPAASLGLGHSRVYARAFLPGESKPALALFATFEVKPHWLDAQPKDPAATNKKGLRLTLDDGTAKTIEPTHDAHWLKNAGLAKGHTCSVEAWLTAPADDLYQFQLQTPMTVSLEVDGLPQPLTATKAWQFVPLALKAGAHRIRIKADASQAEPLLDLRFGSSGTRSIEGEMFQCVE